MKLTKAKKSILQTHQSPGTGLLIVIGYSYTVAAFRKERTAGEVWCLGDIVMHFQSNISKIVSVVKDTNVQHKWVKIKTNFNMRFLLYATKILN